MDHRMRAGKKELCVKKNLEQLRAAMMLFNGNPESHFMALLLYLHCD